MLSLALYCEILGVTLPCRCRSESYRRYARPPHLSHLGLFPFFLFFFSSLVSIMGIFAHVYLFPFSSTSQETPFFPFACNTSVVCGWQYMLWPAGGLHVSHARTTPGQTVRSCLAMLTGLFFRATLFFSFMLGPTSKVLPCHFVQQTRGGGLAVHYALASGQAH